MLGMNLVTIQTGPAGRIVKRLLIEEGLDTSSGSSTQPSRGSSVGRVVSWPAPRAGMEIEEVAKS